MRKSQALIAGILAGIASPATLGSVPEYHRITGSDTGRMRSDVQRVGRDFATVIKRKNGETSRTTSGKIS